MVISLNVQVKCLLFLNNPRSKSSLSITGPVGWGCRIHSCISSNECPGYDIKQSDGQAPVMLELWEMKSTLSLSSLPGPLWPEVVASDLWVK